MKFSSNLFHLVLGLFTGVVWGQCLYDGQRFIGLAAITTIATVLTAIVNMAYILDGDWS